MNPEAPDDEKEAPEGPPFGLLMRLVPVTKTTSRVFMAWNIPVTMQQAQKKGSPTKPGQNSSANGASASGSTTAARMQDPSQIVQMSKSTAKASNAMTSNAENGANNHKVKMQARYKEAAAERRARDKSVKAAVKSDEQAPLSIFARLAALAEAFRRRCLKFVEKLAIKFCPTLKYHVGLLTVLDGDGVFLRQQSLDWLSGVRCASFAHYCLSFKAQSGQCSVRRAAVG